MRNHEIGVIEDCAEPSCCHPRRMATHAGRRVVRRDVIRYRGPIILRIRVVRLVAAVAICRRIARRVIPADVAIGAGIYHRTNRACNRGPRRQHVRSLKREACCAVVKLSIRPGNRVMAGRAHRSREARGNVIRHISADSLRARPSSLVTAVAIRVRRCQVVAVADVAVRASNHFAGRRKLVGTGERPARRAVIKNCRKPGDRVVTGRAIGRRERRSCCRMRRIIRLLPGR